jgi:hypothetical protein
MSNYGRLRPDFLPRESPPLEEVNVFRAEDDSATEIKLLPITAQVSVEQYNSLASLALTMNKEILELREEISSKLLELDHIMHTVDKFLPPETKGSPEARTSMMRETLLKELESLSVKLITAEQDKDVAELEADLSRKKAESLKKDLEFLGVFYSQTEELCVRMKNWHSFMDAHANKKLLERLQFAETAIRRLDSRLCDALNLCGDTKELIEYQRQAQRLKEESEGGITPCN